MTLPPTYGRSWGYLGMLFESGFTTVVTSKQYKHAGAAPTVVGEEGEKTDEARAGAMQREDLFMTRNWLVFVG